MIGLKLQKLYLHQPAEKQSLQIKTCSHRHRFSQSLNISPVRERSLQSEGCGFYTWLSRHFSHASSWTLLNFLLFLKMPRCLPLPCSALLCHSSCLSAHLKWMTQLLSLSLDVTAGVSVGLYRGCHCCCQSRTLEKVHDCGFMSVGCLLLVVLTRQAAHLRFCCSEGSVWC